MASPAFQARPVPRFDHAPIFTLQKFRACLETTRGAVFGEKAGWRDATKENIPGGSSTEEQRSQTAFSAKTLRAAGLLSVAGVGSFLTARCGALRAAKAALATAKIPRRSAPRSFQTGSKMLMVRHFNCGSRNAIFNAALIPALRAATVSPRRKCIARPRRNAE